MYYRKLWKWISNKLWGDAIIIKSWGNFYGAAMVRHFEMMDVLVQLEIWHLQRSRDKLKFTSFVKKWIVDMQTVFINKSNAKDKVIALSGVESFSFKILEGTQGVEL